MPLIGRPDETRYGEAILYGHAARLLRGEALYQPLPGPPYTIASYTPLYYWLAAALQAVAGPGFAPGRWVSLLAGLGTSALVGWLVWRRSRATVPSLAAALLFAGLGLVGPVPWTAAYKEDLLGVALCMASIVLLDVGTGRRTVVTAAAVATCALLTKQSLAGPAVMGTLWLLACGRRQDAAVFGGVIVSVGAITIVTLEATTGAFLANTVWGNQHQPFDWLTFQINMRDLATFQAVPALLALLSLASSASPRDRGEGRGEGPPPVPVHRDLLALNWFGALIPMVPIGAIGADSNYWLHFAAATACLAVLWLWRQRAHWSARVGVALLVANVIVAHAGVVRYLHARPAFFGESVQNQAVMARLVDAAKDTRGRVLADPLDVLVLAGRPIPLEPIVYSLLEADGSWNPARMVDEICRGDIELLILGYPPEELHQRWPLAVADALRQTMRVHEIVPLAGGARFVLMREPGVSCAH